MGATEIEGLEIVSFRSKDDEEGKILRGKLPREVSFSVEGDQIRVRNLTLAGPIVLVADGSRINRGDSILVPSGTRLRFTYGAVVRHLRLNVLASQAVETSH
ncbi:hypothetical protein KC906_04350 [Candidatus Kaiserbacteria bacterium]|nr:hypothetical protein [Candidatus Kaiserbacteria bacterium]USN53251.1 MAG: hypothetical protein H6760_03695 [Candidatus Nomurabacteria bacterium]